MNIAEMVKHSVVYDELADVELAPIGTWRLGSIAEHGALDHTGRSSGPPCEGAIPCPPSKHALSGPSGTRSVRCCHRTRTRTRSAVTGHGFRTMWCSTSSCGSWSSAVPTDALPMRSARRARCGEWMDAGVMDRLIGPELGDLAIDRCLTNAPCGGEVAGRSPVDRGYDSGVTRARLAARELLPEIAAKGTPAPLTAGKQWVVERTNAWTNAHKKLVWCTERRARVINFWLACSVVIIIVGRLIRATWTSYRWDTRPSRRP